MPELPEVETTVRSLRKTVVGLFISDVWSDYFKKTTRGDKDDIKNQIFFNYFRKKVKGRKIKSVSRAGKNILINLDEGATILTHLKMTGHYLYGRYTYDKKRAVWEPAEKGPLRDPFNRFIHLVFTLSNGKHLALSDMRRFAKITIVETEKESGSDLKKLGPDPFDGNLDFKSFNERLRSRPGPVKSILMDQSVLSGIGNIYSDEMLWEVGVNPEEKVERISDREMRSLFRAMRKILALSISLGGDSASDYRLINGEKGGFQTKHKAYRRTGKKCGRKGCDGTIRRKIVRGRSSHYCDVHQKKC